jgi:hypothetical protein
MVNKILLGFGPLNHIFAPSQTCFKLGHRLRPKVGSGPSGSHKKLSEACLSMRHRHTVRRAVESPAETFGSLQHHPGDFVHQTGGKVKLPLKQAVEAYRAVRRRGCQPYESTFTPNKIPDTHFC